MTLRPFFFRQGYRLPPKTNMSDYLFDIIQQKNFKNWFLEDKLRKKAKLSENARNAVNLNAGGNEFLRLPSSRRMPSLRKQVWWTLRRDMVVIYRDPMLYTGRCAAFGIMSVFFALVYIDTSNKNQEQILPTLWLQSWLLCFPCCMACILIVKHCQDTIAMTRNVRNGIQQPIPYLVARLLQVPVMFLFSICCVTIAGYAICGWNKRKYPIVITLHALTLLTFELLAEFFSLFSQNFAVSMLYFIATWFASFLFCGLVVKDENVMWPLRLLCHILPMRYGQRAIGYEELIDIEFSGAQYCNITNDLLCPPMGFKCTGETCFGITGKEVLDSVHVLVDLYSSEDKTTISISILLVTCIILKSLYVLRVLWLVKYG